MYCLSNKIATKLYEEGLGAAIQDPDMSKVGSAICNGTTKVVIFCEFHVYGS